VNLFNFLKRNKDKEEDDDDAYDIDGDSPRTQVIDDDTELAEVSDDQDIILESEIEDAGFADADGEAPADEAMIGEESEIPEFEDDDIDFEALDGEVHGNADINEGDESGRNPMLFVFAGAAVLIIGVIGGAGFWFLGSSDKQAGADPGLPQIAENAVVVAIAPRNPVAGGGLNAIGNGGLSPPSAQASAATATTAASSDASERGVAESTMQAPETAPVRTLAQQRAATLASITGVGDGGSLNSASGTVPRDSGQGLVIPSVTSVSYQNMPDQDRVVPLATAPDQNLVQQVDGMANPLPIIGKDGRQPWQVYARPFVEKTANPKVAIIVKGLGFSRAASMAAIKKLPGEVTLAFSPYVKDLNDWMLRARLSGHEVLLELPLESKGFPHEDAGPLALRTDLQVSDNILQLNNVMSRMTGYIGLLSVMGSKFNEAEGQLKPILTEIKKRGLLFVDGGGSGSRARRVAAEIDLPKAFSNVYLDQPPNRSDMDRKLQGLDQLVRQQAAAVAIIHAYPNTIERILIWIRSMEARQLTLVPVSELANKQFIQ